jgi:hypothetical protein
MQHGERVWVHLKVCEDEVVLRIDIVDGKGMPESEVRRLIDEATPPGSYPHPAGHAHSVAIGAARMRSSSS